MHFSYSLSLLLAFVGMLSCKSEAKAPAVIETDPTVNVNVLGDKSNDASDVIEVKLENKESEVVTELPAEKPTEETVVVPQQDLLITNEKTIIEEPSAPVEDDIDNINPPTMENNDLNNTSEDPVIEETVIVPTPIKIEPNNSESETNNVEEKLEEVGLHDNWNALLSKYVSSSGVVNYKGFKSEEAKLDAYLAELSANVPSGKSDEAMAYWMNAYNAFTVKLILSNYPISSIRDLHDGNPWDVPWIKLGGESYSLNTIEHEILRPTYKDPRIHFAVNCAAKSCPKLGKTAFTADRLNTQLDKLTNSFVNNKQANTLSSGSIQLSKIFEWYKDDFGDLTAFIIKYADEKVSPSASVSFKDYDWSLNGK